ncbi:MAG: outer membrane protein transport protein [Litoreibacter sp.]|uniref:OmpP1/FadL family transporter n=1 Tax=Litoreibacter sp. TaxID=1969459 RepID=UPI0032995121
MKKILGATALLAASTTLASAGNLDRSGQSIAPLFEKGNYAEFSFGYVNPSVSGNDLAPFGNTATGNVADSFSQVGLAYKHQLNENLSFAFIIDQPFGADLLYPTAAAGGSVGLGGTLAALDTEAFTGILRYDFGNRFSIHGGLKAQQLSANVALSGLAYGGLNGYTVNFDDDIGYGYLLGASYEIPDIALRVSLTYNSEVDHDVDTRESFAPGVVSNTRITTPDSWNLDFQTGIAKDTLLFGGVRWVDYSEVNVIPSTFGAVTPAGTSLVTIEDTTTFTLGVGRKFTEAFSGAISVQYETENSPLVSPLAPTNGRIGLTVGGSYTHESMKISGGINYSKLGNATPRTGGTARANFDGNDSIGFGIKVGYSY